MSSWANGTVLLKEDDKPLLKGSQCGVMDKEKGSGFEFRLGHGNTWNQGWNWSIHPGKSCLQLESTSWPEII